MKDSIPIVSYLIAACLPLLAQNPELENYQINETGYSALFPANPGKAEVSLSDNELYVYASEVEFAGVRYGLVMIPLENNFINSEKEVLESVLISYMNFLKLSFDITSSIGFIKEQRHPRNERATGILDFWEDEKKAQWAVKGWIDNDVLAILYVNSQNPSSMPVPYGFLDGFAFKTKINEEAKVAQTPTYKRIKPKQK